MSHDGARKLMVTGKAGAPATPLFPLTAVTTGGAGGEGAVEGQGIAAQEEPKKPCELLMHLPRRITSTAMAVSCFASSFCPSCVPRFKTPPQTSFKLAARAL